MGLLNKIDEKVAINIGKIVPPKKGLISILIHSLYKDTSEANDSNTDPQQSITLEDFEKIITYYLERNYEFLTQDELSTKIQHNKKYCFLTFDDGYYNNIHAIKFLEKYDVPATFYCCTSHIQEQKSFWWDVFYREKRKLGTSINDIRRNQMQFKKLKHSEIDQLLIQEFGKKALKPINDTDRPLNEKELKDFASHPNVQIGNHTHNHIILTNYSTPEILDDIDQNQKILHQITGQIPSTIAYPNGNLNRSQIGDIKGMGLSAGFTVEPGKNYLPIESSDHQIFSLKRYTPWHHNLDQMLKLSETDVSIKKLIKRN